MAPRPGRAFGLDLELGFPAPGLDLRDRPASPARSTVLELAEAQALGDDWSVGAVREVVAWRLPDGSLDAVLEADERGTYRFDTRDYGRYVVEPDGTRIRCAPPESPDWRWQRGLIGQVIPLAAVLRGFEVFHASAVALGGRAVAIVGGSQAGKTSAAVNLILGAGARLLTDDVLVLDPAAQACAAHPGAAVLSLRHAEAETLGTRRVRQLGRVLGDEGEALRVLVAREDRPLPLGAVYFLEPADVVATAVRPMPAPDPRLLLASTFNFFVKTPERLQAQLELCARLASDVPMFRVEVHRADGAAALARDLESHAASALAA